MRTRKAQYKLRRIYRRYSRAIRICKDLERTSEEPYLGWQYSKADERIKFLSARLWELGLRI